MHFEVAVAEYLPFLEVTTVSGKVRMTGSLAEAFHTLSIQLNFSYTLHTVKDNSWGVLGPDGWTGMLGMIERNEVDMAVGPFTVTLDRWEAFKLSSPVYADNVEILVPASEWTMTLFNAVTVFSVPVWMSLFVTLLSLSFTVTVIEKFRMKDINFSLRFFRNLWLNLRPLLQKGRRDRPGCYIHSFLIMLWMFAALIISLLFGGIMLSRLFLRKVQKIDSIYDLISSHDVQPIIETNSAVYSIFEASTSDVYKTIFKRASLQTYEFMSKTGVELVLSSTSAMLTDGMGLKGFLAQRSQQGLPCNCWLAKEPVLTMWKSFAYSLNFSDIWIKKIDQELVHALESGTLNLKMRREYADYERCILAGGSEHTSLSLEHTKGVFLIWSVGCVVAILAFLIEVFKAQVSSNRKKVFAQRRTPLAYTKHYMEIGALKRKSAFKKKHFIGKSKNVKLLAKNAPLTDSDASY